jgi:hypothetical protein
MPVVHRSRSGVMVSVVAVVVGSTVGTALALRGEAARPPVQRNGSAAGVASARPLASVSAPPAVGAAGSSAAVPSMTPAAGATGGSAAMTSAAGAAGGSAAMTPAAGAAGGSAAMMPAAGAAGGSAAMMPAAGAAGGSAGASPSLPPQPAAPDPQAAVVGQIKGAVMRFLLWSHDHPGARCPQAAALGAAAADPWGRPLRIVCADQPADQVVGILSLGPDGLPGTADDVASWALGPEVADLLRGAPWGSVRGGPAKRTPAGPRVGEPRILAMPAMPAMPPRIPVENGLIPAATPAAAAGVPARNARPSASAGAGSSDTDGDGIPDRR